MHSKRFSNPIFDASLRPHNAALVIMLALLFVIFFFVFLTLTAPPALGQTFNVIHTFTGGYDGLWPHAGLTMDARGNLYGTTYGWPTTCGTVYQLVHNASGWHLNLLYSFSGSDGCAPFGRVLFGPGGALYGTTYYGGRGNGYGTVYSLIPPPEPPPSIRENHWIETVLYAFTGGSDGSNAFGDLAFDHAGNIYGAAAGGGSNGCGAVFELTGSGNSWSESVLYSFTGEGDGCSLSGVALQAGDLYGATYSRGAFGNGTVFQLSPSGSGWAENTLYAFQGGNGGGQPASNVILDGAGNIYGSTWNNGFGSFGPGTVWEMMPSGGSWTFSTLYNFTAPGCANPAGPYNAPLTMDQAGNLYGTTNADGAHCLGSFFKLSPSGHGQWTYMSLHDFSGGSDGKYPTSNVLIAANGNLYGTTATGVVWEITP